MICKKPILLVDDDVIDTMTVKRALKEIQVVNDLVCTSNGKEALEYLRNDGNERPCVILLDLNMPKMNGIEFLKVVKQDEVLKIIPDVVLTTSKEDQDKVDSFKLGVAGYMIKAVDYRKFVEVMRMIDTYWTLSQLPC